MNWKLDLPHHGLKITSTDNHKFTGIGWTIQLDKTSRYSEKLKKTMMKVKTGKFCVKKTFGCFPCRN